MYLYELHLHTMETSRCGRSPAVEMVEAYAKAGYTGIVVTDHFVNGNSHASTQKTWKEKMDALLKGYKIAKATGERLGIKVYLGWEFTYQGNSSEDYVTLGLDEDFLYNQAIDCDQWCIERYAKVVHDAGGILVHVHPYREAFYISKNTPVMREGICDAIEVYNGGNPRGTDYDEKALSYAQKFNYPMVAGSDTHHVTTTNIGCVGFDNDPKTYKELCEYIVMGKAHLIRNPKPASD